MNTRIVLLILICISFFSCKSILKNSNESSFQLTNYSTKTIEFIWIAPEGEFYPTVKSVNIQRGESFEMNGLESGIYDIAIDFKGEFNSFNSKKNKELCLIIEKGVDKIWIVDSKGIIKRD